MLVLTRFEGESVLLLLPDGNQIKVMLVRHARNKVRLGFEAPEEVIIVREELADEAQAAN